jgi:hypothetical protein
MEKLKEYASDVAVGACLHCQWEIFPGEKCFVEYGEGFEVVYDRKACVTDTSYARDPRARLEERIFSYTPK